MIVNKITTGFVIQKYDTELKKFVSQEFVAGDECEYEDEEGNPLNYGGDCGDDGDDEGMASVEEIEEYLPYDMRQPEEIEALTRVDGQIWW